MKQEEKLEEAKRLYKDANADQRYVLESLFPELVEIEDVRIRKRIIQALRGDVLDMEETTKAIAWLEKQGGHKPDDKAEPKFHKGEWIIHQGTENIYQVVAVIDNQYQLKYGDNYTIQYCEDVDRCARLWTIQDAKDGDVLVHSSSMFDDFIFIYNNTSILQAYCYYSSERNRFIIEDRGHHCPWNMQEITPATNEQRYILFQKMKEASYEWNAEKKELRKIL